MSQHDRALTPRWLSETVTSADAGKTYGNKALIWGDHARSEGCSFGPSLLDIFLVTT